MSKKQAIKKCNEVFARAKARGCLPDAASKDQVEREDAKWIEEVKADKLRQSLLKR